MKTGESAARPKEGIAAFLTQAERQTLGRMALMSRYVAEGNLAGAHRSPRRGAGAEFADHKSYTAGDDIKHIDWKVLGRTDRYYIKRYEDETNLRVYLVLDRSHSMSFAGVGPSKYDFACRLAAAIGYIVVKARDSIGLFLYSDRIDVRMEARNTLNHLNNLLKSLQDHPPGATTQLAETLHQVAGAVHRRALIVVISDLLSDEQAVTRALAHFRRQHHDVIVLHVLDPMEIDLGFRKNYRFEDLETGETVTADPRALARDYAIVFGRFLDHYRDACSSMRIDYRLARTDQSIEPFLRAVLDERRRMAR